LDERIRNSRSGPFSGSTKNMTDIATVSLGAQGTIAALALAALLRLGSDSGFFSHSHKASNLANQLFDRLSGELEAVLAPLIESDIDLTAIVLDKDGEPFKTSKPRLRINENFRNALDDYLTDGRDTLIAYRSIKDLVARIDAWIKQLRRFTALVLLVSVVGTLAAFLDAVFALSVLAPAHLLLERLAPSRSPCHAGVEARRP